MLSARKYGIALTGVAALAILGVWAGVRVRRRSGEEQAHGYEATARDIRDRLKRAASPPQNGSPLSSHNDRTPDPRRLAFQAQIDAFRKADSEAGRQDALERIMAFVEQDPELLAALLSQLTHDPREPNYPAGLRVNPPMLDPLPVAVARLIGERHLLEASLLALRRLPPYEASELIGFFLDCSENGVANLQMSAVVDRDVRDSLRLLFSETQDDKLKDAVIAFVEKNVDAPDVVEFLKQVVVESGSQSEAALNALLVRGPDSLAPFFAARLNDPDAGVPAKVAILSVLAPTDRPGFAPVLDSARALAIKVTAAIPSNELDPQMRVLHAAALGFLGRLHDPEGARIAKDYVFQSGDRSLSVIGLSTLSNYPTDDTARILAAIAVDAERPKDARTVAVGALWTVVSRTPSLRPYLESVSRDAADPTIRDRARDCLSELTKNP